MKYHAVLLVLLLPLAVCCNNRLLSTNDSIARWVDSLATLDYVQDNSYAIGSSDYPKEYSWFESLLAMATDSQLVSLTDHKRTSVRCYAFWGLAMRHYKGVYGLLKAHRRDSDKIMFYSGCMVNRTYANHLYLDLVSLGDKYQSVTKDELQELRNLLPKITAGRRWKRLF